MIFKGLEGMVHFKIEISITTPCNCSEGQGDNGIEPLSCICLFFFFFFLQEGVYDVWELSSLAYFVPLPRCAHAACET